MVGRESVYGLYSKRGLPRRHQLGKRADPVGPASAQDLQTLISRARYRAYLARSLSICGGSDLPHLATFSASEGSLSGRTIRKPKNKASVKYQMLCGI